MAENYDKMAECDYDKMAVIYAKMAENYDKMADKDIYNIINYLYP